MNEKDQPNEVPKSKKMAVAESALRITLTVIKIAIAVGIAKQQGLFNIGLFF